MAIWAARDSVSVPYVGWTVTVQETATHYALYTGGDCIARHAKAPRYAVVMERIHYQGLFRPGGPPPAAGPPQWDPTCQPQVLIIDEIGYIPIDHRQGANLFFQLVSRRYERGAIILTSNQGLGAWGEVFGDPVIASAILDRLLHHSSTINIKGERDRLREKLKAGLVKSKLAVDPGRTEHRRRKRREGRRSRGSPISGAPRNKPFITGRGEFQMIVDRAERQVRKRLSERVRHGAGIGGGTDGLLRVLQHGRRHQSLNYVTLDEVYLTASGGGAQIVDQFGGTATRLQKHKKK